MSYVITAIISMIFGAGVMACMAMSGRCSEQERQKEALKEAHRIGYQEGHHNGLRKGKVLKIDAALYEELKGRVDVAPGPDSIRPEKWAENETKSAEEQDRVKHEVEQ